MTTSAFEVNFDALPGPTHFYGGLSQGNLASNESKGEVSFPKQAALQSLSKMQFLYKLGVKQAILPPQERPFLPAFKQLGFTGTTEATLTGAKRQAPWLVSQLSSSASMWAANSCTVSPSIDSDDSHLHFTPANLAANYHRSVEAEATARVLKTLFPNPVFFEHHDPLPSVNLFWDEGAANHTRFCRQYQSPGVQLFVYGASFTEDSMKPQVFPARQTKEASEAIVRLHRLFPDHYVLAHQSADAIDAGAFHNDLLSVGNLNLFLLHEKSFFDQTNVLESLKKRVSQFCDTELQIVQYSEEQLPLKEAIQSYFFNSQIVSLPDGSMAVIAPIECQNNVYAKKCFQELLEANDNPISAVHYIDLRQSMKNGGGPACLRLRVVLNEEELKEVLPTVFLNDTLYERLVGFVNLHYPDRLTAEQLSSPELYAKSCQALDELTKILNLGKIYSFQQ